MLDTNVLSELLRPAADRRVVAFIEEQRNPIVCAAVFHELTYGVELLPAGTKKARLSAGIETFRRQFRDRTIDMGRDCRNLGAASSWRDAIGLRLESDGLADRCERNRRFGAARDSEHRGFSNGSALNW